jgi:hypothetical protein
VAAEEKAMSSSYGIRYGTREFATLVDQGWVIEPEALLTVLRLRSLQLNDEMLFIRPADGDRARITRDQLVREEQLWTVYKRYEGDLNGVGWRVVGWRRPPETERREL